MTKRVQFVVNNACEDDVEVMVEYVFKDKHVVEKGKKVVSSTDFAHLEKIEITIAKKEREGDGS